MSDGEIDFGDYLAVLRRRWAWLVIPLLVLPLAAAFVTLRQDDQYRASARVLLADSAAQDAVRAGNVNANALNRQLANEINIANSDITKNEFRRRLGLEPDSALPAGNISSESGSDVLIFQFRGDTPGEAALFANAWADSFVFLKQQDAEASITKTVTSLEERLGELRQQRSDLRAGVEELEDELLRAAEEDRPTIQLQIDREVSAISGELSLIDAQIESNVDSITQLQLSGELAGDGTAQVFQQAAPPNNPIPKPLSRNVTLAIFLAVALGGTAILIRETLDQSVSSLDDLERLGVTPLGAIPQATRELRRTELALVGLTNPGSPIADAYQKVRTALEFASLDTEIRSIVVTSPTQGEGKTTTSVNLAIAFSSVGQRVALIDSDLRRPRIHSVFNTPLTPGITDAVLEGTPLHEMAVRTAKSPETLVAIPAGTQPPNPATFLATKPFGDLVHELERSSDLLILDCPPVLPVADALVVSKHTDGVIFVVSAGSTRRDELRHAIDSVDKAGSRVLGAILIGASVGGRYGKSAYYEDSPSRWGRPKPQVAVAKTEQLKSAGIFTVADEPTDETEVAAPLPESNGSSIGATAKSN